MCVGWVECLGFLEEMVVATTRVISVDPEFILKVESTGSPERLDERGGRKTGARDASKVFGLSSWEDKAVFSWYREDCGGRGGGERMRTSAMGRMSLRCSLDTCVALGYNLLFP